MSRTVRESVWLMLALRMASSGSFFMSFRFVAHAVEDDDGVVDRVADHGEDGGEHRRSNSRSVNANTPTMNRTSCTMHEHGGHSEPELEAEPEVHEDQPVRDDARPERLRPELRADRGADALGAQERDGPEECLLLQHLQHLRREGGRRLSLGGRGNRKVLEGLDTGDAAARRLRAEGDDRPGRAQVDRIGALCLLAGQLPLEQAAITGSPAVLRSSRPSASLALSSARAARSGSSPPGRGSPRAAR